MYMKDLKMPNLQLNWNGLLDQTDESFYKAFLRERVV